MKKERPMHFSRGRRSFTLIELMVMAFVVIVGIVGISGIISRFFFYSGFATAKLVAAYLSQEGVEIVRNIRDSNWVVGGIPWDQGLGAGDYEAAYNDISLSSWSGSGRFLRLNNNFYNYASGSTTKFKRRIKIERNIGGFNEIQVTVTTSWQERGNNYQIEVADIFYEWYTPASSGNNLINDPNLEAFWSMEGDGSLGEIDGSSRGNNLIVSSGAIIPRAAGPRPGTYSRDFELDDQEGLYITDETQNGLDITGPMTVMAWVQAESIPGGWLNFLSKWSGTSNSWYFSKNQIGSVNQLKFVISGGPEVYGDSCMITDTWYHAAAVYDGVDVRLYLDGSLDSTPVPYSGGIPNSSADFWVGNKEEYQDFGHDGLISEVAVFSRALSATEISQIYAQGLTNKGNQITDRKERGRAEYGGKALDKYILTTMTNGFRPNALIDNGEGSLLPLFKPQANRANF